MGKLLNSDWKIMEDIEIIFRDITKVAIRL